MNSTFNQRSWNYLVNRWFYFFKNIPKTLNRQFLQLDLEFSEFSSIQRKSFVIIFQYGGAQFEWSFSLNRCSPKTSSCFQILFKKCIADDSEEEETTNGFNFNGRESGKQFIIYLPSYRLINQKTSTNYAENLFHHIAHLIKPYRDQVHLVHL